MLRRRPRIYTTYFGMLKKLPKDIVPISVCRYPPKWYTGLKVTGLAPDETALKEYKQNGDWETFKREYNKRLKVYRKDKIREMLLKMGYGKAVALVCFEKDDNCHRHLLGLWLGDVREYGLPPKFFR